MRTPRIFAALFSLAVLFGPAQGVQGQGQIPVGPGLIPVFPDSVYLNAEMVVGEGMPEYTGWDVPLYGWLDLSQTPSLGFHGVWGWLDETTTPRFGILDSHYDLQPGIKCRGIGPDVPGWEYGPACMQPASLFQIAEGDSVYSGYVFSRFRIGGPPPSTPADIWEKFVEGAKLIIAADTLLFSQGTKCDNLPANPYSYPMPTGWACWEMDRMLFATDDVLSIQIRAPILYPLPGMPGALRTWQHRTTGGKTVKGTVWLSWRIPIEEWDPLEQLRLEKKHGIHYEYRVLRDGNKQWRTLLIEDTKTGEIEEVRTVFGIRLYQRRKHLVTGLDPNGEYSFCIRAFNASGRSEEVCNLDVITPVSVGRAELPDAVSLSQNYPNPFNPSTSVTYALPRSGPVELSVYDLTGRIVETLVDGIQPAGSHTVHFDPGGLPSGTYVYRLRVGAETLTRSMILVR